MSHSKNNTPWRDNHFTVKPPCLNCEVREPACHDHCDKYADYRKVVENVHEARRKQTRQRYIRTDHNAQIKASPISRQTARRRKNNEL